MFTIYVFLGRIMVKFIKITTYRGWLRNPAPPGMVESPTKPWDVYHLLTGAGFRNYPQYCRKSDSHLPLHEKL